MKGYHKLIRPTNTFGYNEKNSSFFAADSIFNRSLFSRKSNVTTRKISIYNQHDKKTSSRKILRILTTRGTTSVPHLSGPWNEAADK